MDASYRNNDDGSSQRGMTGFLADSRSIIDDDSQKTVAELYSFTKCFGSCQFLRGMWMDISGEVANLHMRTDAKNLVTTATTIHPLSLTAICINDTKKRQLLTRSGLPRVRCCVCHLHHKWAMKCVTSRLMSCGQCFSIQVLPKSGVPRSVRFLSCSHAKSDAPRGQYGTPIWKQASH